MLKAALAGTLLLGVALAAAPEARAESPVTCGPNLSWDGQKCQIIATAPGDAGGSGNEGTTLSDTKGSDSSAPTTCSVGSTIVPCTDSELGWWSQSRGCYIHLSSPQPPTSALVWGGRTDGAIYDCAQPRSGTFGGVMYTFWSATAPAGPDPQVLAQTAIATMDLRPVTIGIVPEDRPGSVGLVGMPVWLWAADTDSQSWGPVTRTASAGGETVTATAKVSRVRWLMGDGAVVVCTGPGTEYEDRFGKAKSPTCGHTYTRQGTYTVRAESQWTVSWAGMGRSGTIPVTLTQTARVTIGELQVLTTG